MTDPSLFDDEARRRGEHYAEPPLAQAFRVFDDANPHVYAELVRLTDEWRRRRVTSLGVGMLWEVMRWNLTLSTAGEPFKLNNNHRSFYARKLIAHAGAAGLFETRKRDETCECSRCVA